MSNSFDTEHVIFVDTANCKGCMRCELACIASHNDLTFKEAVKQRKNFKARLEVIRTESAKMPIMCRQCEDAPCAHVCPTGSLSLQEDGRSTFRPQLCAGCGLCIMACPYGAMLADFKKLDEKEKIANETEERMYATRCDLCVNWRAKEHKNTTACAEACSAGVLHYVTHAQHKELEILEATGKKIPLPAHMAKKEDAHEDTAKD